MDGWVEGAVGGCGGLILVPGDLYESLGSGKGVRGEVVRKVGGWWREVLVGVMTG